VDAVLVVQDNAEQACPFPKTHPSGIQRVQGLLKCRRENGTGTSSNLTRCKTAESCCGAENSLIILRVLESRASAINGIAFGLIRRKEFLRLTSWNANVAAAA